MVFPFQEAPDIIEKIIAQAKLTCKACKGKARIELNNNSLSVRCCWSACRQKRALWNGTIFEDSKLGSEKVLRLIHLWFIGLSPRHICAMLGLGRKSFSRIMTKMSLFASEKYYSSTTFKIGGSNMIIEIDESKFGLRKYNRGHRVDGVWVLGMVERSLERKIMLIAVENRKSDTLTPIIKKYVKSDSILYTDCWKGYSDLKNQFSSHCTVNHSVGFVDSITGVHTNTIEGNWCSVKKSIPSRCRTKDLVSLYLIKYMLTRNFKESAFYEFIKLLF